MSLRPSLLLLALCFLPGTGFAQVGTEAEDPKPIVDPDWYEGLEFRLLGPFRGGRSTAAAGVPSLPYTFYMGTTGGGVWKTDDAGETWANVSDGYFQAGSIGAISVSDSDPAVIFVGTGSNAPRGNVSPGIGVYRSTDAGKSWEPVGLQDSGQVSRIRIHPHDPDLVYVAALGHIFGPNQERGVFRSADGGKSWEKILFVSERTGAVDLAMSSNPRVLYAGMWTVERKPWTLTSGSDEGGVYRTTDGGDTWQKLSGGLPEGFVGKIGIAVSPVDPDRVWALVEAEEGGLSRSDDGGESWSRVNQERKLRQRAWYYTRVYADPLDENSVYALNTSFYKSVDAGKTFKIVPVLHGDCHDLWLNPNDPRIMIQTNDGGAHVSLNGGKSWSTLNNQPTSEIYRVTVDQQFPYRVYGAQQDNSTISLPSRRLSEVTPYQHWQSVGGCESGHIAVDPRNPDIVYAGCYGGSISRTDLSSGHSQSILVYPQLQLGQAPRDLKYRFQWNAPIRISPHNPDVVYHTSQYVHRTSDGGHSWETISPDLTRNDREKQDYAGTPITRDNTGVEVFGTVFAFEESPHTPGILWAGSDDGLVHISKDNGVSWTDITPPQMPPWATVNMIELSRHREGRALLAVQRYRLDDFSPYIFVTHDSGDNWRLLTGTGKGFANHHFVRVVREDPDRENLIYAGTEFGLYVSFNGGEHWQSLQLNLPVSPVTDLAVREQNLVVATQGRSFWILDDLNLLHQLDQRAPGLRLFKPKPAVRAFFGRSSSSPGNRSTSSPPNGVVLQYYLPEETSEKLKVDIVDSAGEVVRTFESDTSDTKNEPNYRGSDAPAEKGLNQLVWDLRYPDIDKPEGLVVWGSTGGSVVLPGTYQVGMALGDWTAAQEFSVVRDPRVDASPADLQEQHRLAVLIRSRIEAIYETVTQIRSIRSQITDLAQRIAASGRSSEPLEKDASEIKEELSDIEGQLVQVDNESSQDPLNFPPMLDNQYVYLYGYVSGGNARPTVGARDRFRDLEIELDVLLDRFNTVIEEDLAAFNRRYQDLPAILVPSKN